MNFRQFLLPLTLAIITTIAIQYFFLNRHAQNGQTPSIQSGQTFIAPANVAEAQPLNKMIEYAEGDASGHGTQTVVATSSAEYLFSSHGACLTQLTFKRIVDGKAQQLRTINPADDAACNFLVALGGKTPLRYTLVDQKELTSESRQITYRAETDQAIIQKTFTVHDAAMQIDLDLSIVPKQGAVQVRIFFGSPVTFDVGDTDKAIAAKINDPYNIISGIYNTAKGSIKKESLSNINLNQGWFMPTLFGSENRYFVHALVADQNNFAQRAYYATSGTSQLTSILESAVIAKPTQWHLSFYVGPKEDAAMSVVDPRLEQTLEYSGWLAPLSRLLLMILNFLYQYVHNYGWAIVLMTILINLVLLPLNIRSAQSLKKYNEFQKKLAYVKQRYKDDPEVLAREQTELVRKHGMPMGGCLPKLLQLPIFIALSRVLSNSFELYHAPFLWMNNLSAKDPYYILPILIVVSMISQATATDPKQKFMVIGVALVFGAAAANFSAGLSLYILVGVVLNGIQMYLQNKLGWA